VILDTNAVSAFAEGDPLVRDRITTGPGPYLPVIVLGEYRFGLLGARDRQRRLAWLEQLTRHWAVLEISLDTASAYAQIWQTLMERATPIPSNDVWIAALARQHNLSILSADAHFDSVPGIRRLSWRRP
jgi:predicted nucleic acid-binding protein